MLAAAIFTAADLVGTPRIRAPSAGSIMAGLRERAPSGEALALEASMEVVVSTAEAEASTVEAATAAGATDSSQEVIKQ